MMTMTVEALLKTILALALVLVLEVAWLIRNHYRDDRDVRYVPIKKLWMAYPKVEVDEQMFSKN